MADRAKRRAPQHLIDERGIALLKRLLPENWVVREYRPDYGLDFAVEVFEMRQFNILRRLESTFLYNSKVLNPRRLES
jgi:hypothetical protein